MVPTFSILAFVLAAGGQLFEMSQAEVDEYIQDLAAQGKTFGERVEAAARKGLGTPYADGPLGEGPAGAYDTDPLVDFSKADCVTYVEQSIALGSASTYSGMFDLLQRIRYKNGDISFEARNHFMISDWIANNGFCVNVTRALDVQTQSVTRLISKKGFFARVNAEGLGKDIGDEEVTLHYVPSGAAAASEKALPSPALLVFIGKVDWLFSLHCGLFLRDGKGSGKLYHASSKAAGVVAADLDAYVAGQGDRYIGFTAYAITEPPAK